MRGYFTWSVGGYNEVFHRAADLVRGSHQYGREIRRDEAMVAIGSGQNDASFMAPLLDDVLRQVEFGFIADLGSGTSSRLARILVERPGVRGLGIDVSEAATTLGQQALACAGLSDRATAMRADALEILFEARYLSPLSEVDAVMSFFLLHDLLADPARRASVVPRLREAFPRAHLFVLADTMARPTEDPTDSLPIFSVGFELAHALMGVPLHERSTYEDLFRTAGLRVRRRVPFGTPHSWLYILDCD
jgi:hypothetical protein